jgi:signal transduction histidine kinase
MIGQGSLARRIAAVIALFSAGVTAVLGLTGVISVTETQKWALSERLALAQAAADHLDHVVRTNMQYLQEVEFASGVDLARDNGPRPGAGAAGSTALARLDPIAAREALRNALRHSVFEAVFLADGTGHERVRFPGVAHGQRQVPVAVSEALRRGVPVISGVTATVPSRRRTVFVVVPLRDPTGKVVAAVGGEIDPTAQGLRGALATIHVGSSAYMDLLDADGVVIASTQPSHIAELNDHRHVIAELIKDRRTSVGACHHCHGAEERTNVREDEIMAFAPLTAATWGVTLRQSASEALAPARRVRSRFIIFGLLIVSLALLLSWGMARSVVRPVKVLTGTAERIAGGDLARPVPTLGDDEMGHLARAFETMRERLRRSLDGVRDANRTLEARVQERTAELERLYQELQRKEALRGELLRKVITAQEEERKRIARELHDETAQLLTTLGILVETAASGGALGRDALQKARALSTRTLEGVHTLIHDLRPTLLDDLGLRSAIRECAERLEERGLSVTFREVGAERRLPGEVETALFRVAQEALQNISRHADASDVDVLVEYGGDHVLIEVVDDGRGFDPAADGRPVDMTGRGLGLLGMRERIALCEGQISIESTPGQGTRVRAWVPVRTAPPEA